MRGDSLRFFKPPVFRKTVLIFSALFSALLFNSCKQLASFDPGVDGGRVVVSNEFSAPKWSGNGVTNGLKQKISLEWIPVSGSKNYYIYCAESSTAEFKKVGETTKNSFDDKVGAGRTRYYKVCAVKSNGVQSAFSVMKKGTSLAQPIISGGSVDENSATISWFMENARGVDGMDNYESSLIFEICCQPKSGAEEKSVVKPATDFKNSSYEYTFENLSGSTEYQFYVKAYISGDQQNSEQSAKVTKETLTSYMPVAPEFTASQGDSAKGIWLFIKLPALVMVNTVTTKESEAHDEPYPLCFQIERQSEGGSTWTVAAERLYYNGTTTAPEKSDYLDADKGYKAGAEIRWFDDGADLQGGVKYTYRIRSFVDVGYSDVVGSTYNAETGTKVDMAANNVGWKSAHPEFTITKPEGGGKTFSDDGTKVCSVTFGFNAEWKDLGTADKYKFAIQQNRKALGAGTSDTDTWLPNENGGVFFATLDEVNSRAIMFGSEESGLTEDDQGIYSYTLYIVPVSETAATDDENKILDSVKALDEIQVTPDAELPEAELTVKDGYKDKVVLTVAIEKPGEKYTVVRTRLENGQPQESAEFKVNVPAEKNVENGTVGYEDTGVQGGYTYSYVLKAFAPSGAYSSTISQTAETLGTPEVSFEKAKLNYDSVTISFAGVLAAERYVVKLGADDSFGGGETFEITKDENGEWKTGENAVTGSKGASADVAFAANKFTVTMKKPYGYNDATLAGVTAQAIVTAYSAVDNASSEAVDVNVIGPACLDAKVSTDIKENSISLSWNAVYGAQGYLIRRVMYDDAEMSKVSDSSGITYYYDVSGTITADDEKVNSDRVTVTSANDRFTLTDKYEETDDKVEAASENYQKAQAKISWGLPFRYVVLPVLNKGDFGFSDSSLELGKGGKVAYTNLASTDPASTLGYGLNVRAEKSKNTETQTITWEKPYSVDKGAKPRVYRRVAGTTGTFSLIESSTNCAENRFGYNPTGSDLYEAYEYIVKYNSISDTSSLPKSLEDTFKETKDDESPTEQQNKGYLFAIQDYNLQNCGLSAKHGTDYAELVQWTENMRVWDYEKRALGPTGIKLYIRNNNLDDKWHEAAAITGLDYSGTVTSPGDADVLASIGNDGVRLSPKRIAEGGGTTDGLLKVLRDYKHYYGLSLMRGAAETEDMVETNKYTPGFDEWETKPNTEEPLEPVYAYRQITDEELVKTTMLTLADMEQDSGMEEHTTGGSWSLTGANGGIFKGSGSGGSELTWSIDNYQHKWRKLPSGQTNVPSFITLNDTGNNVRGRKYSAYLVYLCNGVSGTNDFSTSKLIPLKVQSDVYGEATVHFATGTDEQKTGWFSSTKTQRFIVKVERNGSTTFTKEVEGEENCRYWCPITWYKSGGAGTQNGTGYFGEDPTYGWWPSSSN